MARKPIPNDLSSVIEDLENEAADENPPAPVQVKTTEVDHGYLQLPAVEAEEVIRPLRTPAQMTRLQEEIEAGQRALAEQQERIARAMKDRAEEAEAEAALARAAEED